MSSYIDDETEKAVEDTRKRRRKVFAAGRRKSRQDAISEPRQTPQERSEAPAPEPEQNG